MLVPLTRLEIFDYLERRGIRPFSDHFKSKALNFVLKFHGLKPDELSDKSLADLEKKIEEFHQDNVGTEYAIHKIISC